MEQSGAAFDRSSVNQAGRDLYVNASPAPGPGLATLVVPEEVTHTVRGRADLLDRLSEAGGQVVVLHGNGGHGKTTVAVQFARRSAAELWWVDASNATGLGDGLREVALRAGADERAVKDAWAGASSAPEVLWKALDARSRPWFLILDNADDPTVLSPDGRVATGRGWLRTPRATGTVLITSRDGRRSQWGNRAVLLPVDVLGIEDAAAMLLELAPGAGDAAGARDLAERLGGLPLALRLAGRYLRSTSDAVRLPGAVLPRTFAEYDSALVDHPDADDRESLSRTWELSLDLLAKRGRPLTRPLMRLLSTFAQAPIPVELLDAAVLAESEQFRGITVQELSVLVEDLLGLGLVEHRANALVLHPLVREANLRLANGYEALQTEVLVRLVVNIPPKDRSTWPLWRTLAPHCIEVRGERSGIVTIYRQLSHFYFSTGFMLESEEFLRRAVAIHRKSADETDSTLIFLRSLRIPILAMMGRLDEVKAEVDAAQELLRKNFEARGLAVPARDELKVKDVGGHDEEDHGDRSEAEWRKLLKSRREDLGEFHFKSLLAWVGMLVRLDPRGRVEELREETRQCLRLVERSMGRDSLLGLDLHMLLERLDEEETANPPP